MPIVNALAGIMVHDLDAAVAWYEKLSTVRRTSGRWRGWPNGRCMTGPGFRCMKINSVPGFRPSRSPSTVLSSSSTAEGQSDSGGVNNELGLREDRYGKDPSGNRVVFAELTDQL